MKTPFHALLLATLALSSCIMTDMATRQNVSATEKVASGMTSVIGAPYEALYGVLSGVEQVMEGEKNPTFYFDKNKKLPAYLDSDEMELAERMLKQGASPHFKVGGKSAVYHYAYQKERKKAELLVRYGGKKSDITKAEAQRKVDDIKALAEAKERAKRQRVALDAFTRFMQRGMAQNNGEGLGAGDAPPDVGKAAGDEEQRFKDRFRGRTVNFVVKHDDGGGFASTNDLVLQDPATGKKFSVGYTYGFAKSLGVRRGERVSVRFSGSGEPLSIKNPATGVGHEVERWSARGYGW